MDKICCRLIEKTPQMDNICGVSIPVIPRNRASVQRDFHTSYNRHTPAPLEPERFGVQMCWDQAQSPMSQEPAWSGRRG